MNPTTMQRLQTEGCSLLMEDLSLKTMFEECFTENDKMKQLAHLKKIAQYMKRPRCAESDMEAAIHCLVKIYQDVEPKSAHRRKIASILQSLPDAFEDLMVKAMAEQLVSYLQMISDDITSLRRGIEFIAVHLENFPIGEMVILVCVQCVLQFLQRCLRCIIQSSRGSSYAVERSALMYHCLACLKTTMAVLQKCVQAPQTANEQISSTSLEDLLKLSNDILSGETFSLDCVSASGLTVALLNKIQLGEEVGLKKLTSHLLLDLADPCQPTGLVTMVIPGSPSWQRLFLLNGILSMYAPTVLAQTMITDDTGDRRPFLTDLAFWEIIKLNSMITSASLSVYASSVLLQWTQVARAAVSVYKDCHNYFVGSGAVLQEILSYIWRNWNHTVDVIRYKCRDIFGALLDIHSIRKKDTSKEDPFLLDILNRLIPYSWHIRSKYGLLTELVKYFRVGRILVLHPTIVRDLMMAMTEQSIAPYSSELLAKLYQQHYAELGADESSWSGTWLRPALEIMQGNEEMKQQARYLTEYFIPAVLKFNPSSLTYVIDAVNSDIPMEDSTKLSMTVTWLKIARAVGVLKSAITGSSLEADRHLWKGIVPVSVLQQSLSHRDSQVIDAVNSDIPTENSPKLYITVTWLKIARALSADTLSLICDSSRTTEEFTTDELHLLRSSLPLHMASHVAAERQQRVAAIKKMLFRFRESSKVFEKNRMKAREKDDTNEEESANAKLKAYKDFVDWLLRLLVEGLAPGHSYSRRVTSLMILTTIRMLYKGEPCPVLSYENLLDSRDVPILLQQLSDTFDSNRSMAFDLLRDIKQETFIWEDAASLTSMYDCALRLASSPKPHHCETAAYLLRLLGNQHSPVLPSTPGNEDTIYLILDDLCKALTEQISRGQASLFEAATSGPMYGVLHCIRAMLLDVNPRDIAGQSQYVALFQRIVSLCHEVAGVASPTVCSSSPEGFLPESEQDVPVTDEDEVSPNSGSLEVFHVTPQMVLVCCWRSMKEVSLTLGHLAMALPLEGDGQYLLSCRQVKDMGTLFLQLLRESKHRGAFELAYTGFEKLSATLWRAVNPSLASLPKQWLDQILSEVTAGTDALCATRRSAGVPFAIQAIVGTEPYVLGRPNFNQTMITLTQLLYAEDDEGSVRKVHALNILRALYRDSRLGDEVFPFLAEGIQAAITGFASHQWAVRNSSTLLFSALVTRIFGVNREKDELSKKNCMAVREFFSRFPSLLPFLTEQLEKSIQSSNDCSGLLHPSLFPTLIILSHLHPSYQEDDTSPSHTISVIVSLIIRCAGCAVYKTRHMAARAIRAIIPLNDVIAVLVSLVQSLPMSANDSISQNHVHGTLLMISSIIDGHIMNNGAVVEVTEKFFTEIIPLLQSRLWLASSENKCPTTRSAYLQITNKVVMDKKLLECTSLTTDAATLLVTLQGELMQLVLPGIDQSPSSFQPDHVNLAVVQAVCILRYLSRLITSSQDSGNKCNRVDGQLALGGTAISVTDQLMNLLQSPFYEVRSLALTTILNDAPIFLNAGARNSSERGTSSEEMILQKETIVSELVTMAIGKETNPECLEKVLELLSKGCPPDMITTSLEGDHILSKGRPPDMITTSLEEDHILCREQFVTRLLMLAENNQGRSNLCVSIISLSGIILGDLEGDCLSSLLLPWLKLVQGVSDEDILQRAQVDVCTALCGVLTGVTKKRKNVPVHLYIRLWHLLLQLLLQYTDTIVQEAMECLSGIAAITGMTESGDRFNSMRHPTYVICATVGLFTQILIEIDTPACLSELCSWSSGGLLSSNQEESTASDGESEESKLFERGESSAKVDDDPVIQSALLAIDSIRTGCGLHPELGHSQTGPDYLPIKLSSQLGDEDMPNSQLRATGGNPMELTGLASGLHGNCKSFPVGTENICRQTLKDTACTLYNQYCSHLEVSIQIMPLFTSENAFFETDEFEANWVKVTRLMACVRHLTDLCKSLQGGPPGFDDNRMNKIQQLIGKKLGKFGPCSSIL